MGVRHFLLPGLASATNQWSRARTADCGFGYPHRSGQGRTCGKHRIIQQEPMRSLFLSWRTCRSLPDGICLRLSRSAASCSCWKYAWQRRLRIPLHPAAPQQHQGRPFMNPGQFMSVGGKWRGSIGQEPARGRDRASKRPVQGKGRGEADQQKHNIPAKEDAGKRNLPLLPEYISM